MSRRTGVVNRVEEFTRRIRIHICKDGTISYLDSSKGEKVFNGRALPVFSVDTVRQAQDIQVLFGRKQWTEHPDQPGRPWYRWTDFPGELDALDDITQRLRQWWQGEKEVGRA